jgi:hypothetical protein
MNADDILKYGHDFVMRHLAHFPEGEWETPNVCGWWSTKQIIAHLASFEHLLVDVLNAQLGAEPRPTLQRMFEIGPARLNDVEVAERDGWTAQETMADYRETCEQTMALLGRIPLSARRRAGALPWYGAEYDLEDYIVYTFYGHKREHTAQVNVFLDRVYIRK